MSGWKPCGGPHVQQRTFGRKVGHVVYNGDEDTWLALFDGIYLGWNRNEADARYEVELASRFQLPDE